MSEMPGAAVVDHDGGTAAGWLSLAAAPAFAVMAVWTAASGGPPGTLCTAQASPLEGMALMYALMSASHAVPWLKLMSRQGRRRVVSDRRVAATGSVR